MVKASTTKRAAGLVKPEIRKIGGRFGETVAKNMPWLKNIPQGERIMGLLNESLENALPDHPWLGPVTTLLSDFIEQASPKVWGDGEKGGTAAENEAVAALAKSLGARLRGARSPEDVQRRFETWLEERRVRRQAQKLIQRDLEVPKAPEYGPDFSHGEIDRAAEFYGARIFESWTRERKCAAIDAVRGIRRPKDRTEFFRRRADEAATRREQKRLERALERGRRRR